MVMEYTHKKERFIDSYFVLRWKDFLQANLVESISNRQQYNGHFFHGYTQMLNTKTKRYRHVFIRHFWGSL